MMELARAVLLVPHLVAGATACGAPAAAALLAMWPSIRTSNRLLIARLLMVAMGAMALAALFGAVSAALILAAEDRGYADAFSRLPAYDLGMLVAEWFITLASYGLMAWLARRGLKRPWLFAFIAVFGVTNLAYHFPTMMSVLGAEAREPTLVGNQPLDRAAFRERVFSPAMLARTAHFWALCVATGAAAAAVVSTPDRKEPGGQRIAAIVAWLGLAALSLLLKTGVATLLLLPAVKQRAMTGGDPLATGMLIIVLGMMAAAVRFLLPPAAGRQTRLPTRFLLATIWTAVLMMVLITTHVTAGP